MTAKRRRNPSVDIDEVLGKFAEHVSRRLMAYFDEENIAVEVGPIPPEMFRKLISLCHPDKHQNSQTSVEVTRWLLEQRGK